MRRLPPCFHLPLLVLLLAPAAATAVDEEALLQRIEELEARILDLEDEARAREDEEAFADQNEDERDDDSPFGAEYEARQAALAAAAGAGWTNFVTLSGHAEAGWFGGSEDGVFHELGFEVWDARFFVDAQLGEFVELGDWILARDLRLAFEWDLVRLGDEDNRVGELFVEARGLLDSDWTSVQVGRFQLPVGEAYLRYSRGAKERPFITNAVGGPWFWDEGVKLFGTDESGAFGYVASVTDGDTSFGRDDTGDKQVSLKLFLRPVDWLQLSVSGLRSGNLGDGDDAAGGSLWIGEAWARAFGSGSDVPNWVGGVPVPDGPNQIRDTWLLGGDAIAAKDWGRLWLSYGVYEIDSRGMSLYDRTLHYWIAELILEGELVSESLDSVYAGLRASGLGTYDRDEGYLLDSRYRQILGYNMRSLDAYSAVFGWRITEWLRLRSEATYQDIRLVRGVSPEVRADADDATLFSVELDAHF